MEHYTGLFGWMDDEEAQAEAQEARRKAEVEKEAGEAFDKMMGNADKEVNKMIDNFWKGAL